MYHQDDVTVYVPCYQAAATLPEVLASITRLNPAPGAVLLIDDGSDPPVAELPAAAGFQIVRHRRNRGLAAARNTALAACRTALIAGLDADVLPVPDWLGQLLSALNRDDAAGAGGRLDEGVRETLGDRWRAVHMAQHWGDAPVADPRFLYGSNHLLRVDAVRAVGGWDVQWRTNNEDASLCASLYRAGFHLVYEPAARAEHRRRDSNHGILRGYWQWHAAKGRQRGDFDRPEALVERVAAVNFGIFRYRFDLDRAAGREDLLCLDALLPWVFCALDLFEYRKRQEATLPDFPGADLLAAAGPAANALHLHVPRTGGDTHRPWHGTYRQAVAHCLRQHRWLDDCAHDQLYDPLQHA